MDGVSIGRFGGVEILVTPAAGVGLALLWIALAAFGFALLQLMPLVAALAGLAAALLHFTAALAHHLSHAIAARGTGHPMRAVRFGRMLVLATSIYPEDEPEIPGWMHVRRAIGGPIGSLLLALLAGGIALGLRSTGGLSYWLVLFLALDSLFVFTIGVLIPLGFTDMSTILRWRGR